MMYPEGQRKQDFRSYYNLRMDVTSVKCSEVLPLTRNSALGKMQEEFFCCIHGEAEF